MSTIRISGTLVRNAECRITAGQFPKVVIAVELATDDAGDLPVRAAYTLPGAGYVPQVAGHSAARNLRRGTRVTVYAAGLREFGRAVCLRGVDAIRADDSTAAQHYLEKASA